VCTAWSCKRAHHKNVNVGSYQLISFFPPESWSSWLLSAISCFLSNLLFHPFWQSLSFASCLCSLCGLEKSSSGWFFVLVMGEHRKNIIKAVFVANSSLASSTQSVVSLFCLELGVLGCRNFLFQYLSCWTTFKSYCSVHSLGVWSCSPEDLIGFLQSVYDRTLSFSSCYQHLSAVAHYYRLRGLVSPSTGPVVSMYMRGLKRKCLADQASIKRAKPLSRWVWSGDRSLC